MLKIIFIKIKGAKIVRQILNSCISVYNQTQEIHTTVSTQTVALQVDSDSKNLNLSFESESELHSTFDCFKLQQNLDRNYDANGDSCLIVFWSI